MSETSQLGDENDFNSDDEDDLDDQDLLNENLSSGLSSNGQHFSNSHLIKNSDATTNLLGKRNFSEVNKPSKLKDTQG